MKLGEIWDYVIRRKVLLLFLFAISVVGGTILAKCLADQIHSSLSYSPKLDIETTVSSAPGSTEQYLRLIENYQKTISADVLNNKKLDSVNKARVIQAYESLDTSSRAPYTEFIAQLKRGGVPEISFSGPTVYQLGDEIPLFVRQVTIYDNEDGDETGEMSRAGLKAISNFNAERAGEYYVKYSITDSDGNSAELTVNISVVDPTPEQPTPEPEPDTPAQTPSVTPNPPETSGSVGAGVNLSDTQLETELPSPVENENIGYVHDSANQEDNIETTDKPTSIIENLPNNSGNKPSSSLTFKDSSEKESVSQKTSTWSAWNFLWIALGVLGVVILVRFIFDHYVRWG